MPSFIMSIGTLEFPQPYESCFGGLALDPSFAAAHATANFHFLDLVFF